MLQPHPGHCTEASKGTPESFTSYTLRRFSTNGMIAVLALFALSVTVVCAKRLSVVADVLSCLVAIAFEVATRFFRNTLLLYRSHL